MAHETSVKGGTLVKAAILFCQKALSAFPGSSIESLDQHYSDEDLTLEVAVPEGTDIRHASDELTRIALEVEDQYGATIMAWAASAKGTGA